MIDKESDIRPIGYGAMLVEGIVGVMALIAATALEPGDYFAINTSPAVHATLGMPMVHLADLQQQVGENVVGRTGGAVSLAVGMAQIFSGLPGMRGLMAYWYHFAIMFEALFILTTIDTGTRIARFLLQEALGKVHPKFEQTDWLPGAVLATGAVTAGWGVLIYTGSIDTIWPMFGIANQLLAVIALAVGSMVIINMGKVRYVWITLVPLAFVATTTLTAGALSIWGNFIPLAHEPGKTVIGFVNAALTAIMMGCVLFILSSAIFRLYGAKIQRDTGSLAKGSNLYV